MMYNPPKYDRYFSKNELTYIKTTKLYLKLIFRYVRILLYVQCTFCFKQCV